MRRAAVLVVAFLAAAPATAEGRERGAAEARPRATEPRAAAAERRADLRPSAPRLVGPRSGPTLVVVDVVRNVGRRRSRTARATFRLARGAAELVVGRRLVPALRPLGVSRRTVTLRLPAGVAPGTWRLLACVAGRCRAAVLRVRIPFPRVLAPPPPPPPPPPPEPAPRVAEEPPPAPEPEPEPSTDRAGIEDCGVIVAADDDPAEAFTAMFAQTTKGWTGGDATFSVELPDGRTAWVFGDTFLGGLTEGGGRDRLYPDVRNSIVVQDDECLTTHFRGTADVPFSFEPEPAEDRWYWPNQPVVHGDELRVFLTRMRDPLTAEGSALATYDLGLDRLAVDETIETLPSQWWGAAVVDEDPYTYVYGIRHGPPRDLLLARTPFQDLDGAWEYRTAAGWSDDVADAEPVLAAADDLATQVSVLRDGDDWLLIHQDAAGDDLLLRRAPEPYGPWSDPETLVALPPVPGAQTYNALVHEALTSPDGLLVSYNVIPDEAEAGKQDASLYRPRFVRVALP